MLQAIHSDMLNNLADIERVAEAYANQATLVKEFLVVISQEYMDGQVPQWAGYANLLWSVATFTPFDGSLAAYNLELIEDRELRSMLGTWIGLAADLVEASVLEIQDGTTLMTLAAPSGAIYYASVALDLIPETPDQQVPTINTVLSKLRADQQFIDALLVQNVTRQTLMRKIGVLKESTEEILIALAE